MSLPSEPRMQFLRPSQIVARLKKAPVVYVPFGPLEWHGPHMPFGTDPLNAENVALKACARTGGVVWPTQFWGTERERSAAHLASLGLPKGAYVVGMDFPRNILPSMYCREEVFAVVVREILRQTITLGAKLTMLINGHGGENHMRVLDRLAVEFTNTTPLKVVNRIAAPLSLLAKSLVHNPLCRPEAEREAGRQGATTRQHNGERCGGGATQSDRLRSQPEPGWGCGPDSTGSGGHADAGETSVMMHVHPKCVDLKALPPLPRKIKYTDFAVVDGPGFDGNGPKVGFTLGRADDPRVSASADRGRKAVTRAVQEIAREVSQSLRAPNKTDA